MMEIWRKEIEEVGENRTPYFLVSRDRILENIQKFRRALPGVKIFYAVKALSEQKVIETMKEKVDGFDVASYGEMSLVRGVSEAPIVYGNPVKIPAHISDSHKKGVFAFAFDSAMELEKIALNAPGANVYLRLKVVDQGSSFPLSSKFGAEAESAVELFRHAQHLGLSPIGVTFHVGSQATRLTTWKIAIKQAGEVIQNLIENGFNVKMLDLGGGFPAPYFPGTTSIEAVGAVVQQSLSKFIPSNIEIIAEPGRFLVASTAVLVSSVIGREKRGDKEWLFLDTGIFNGLMEPLEISDWKYPIFTTSAAGAVEHCEFVLTGPSCDSQDTFSYGTMLPKNISIGDKIFIGYAGAYTRVYSSAFNGFQIPDVIYCGEKKPDDRQHLRLSKEQAVSLEENS